MDTVTESSHRHTLPARQVHLIGMISIWFLILLSPTLGNASLLPIGFLDHNLAEKFQEIYISFHAPLWEPFWDRLGYDYYLGYVSCESNRDSTLAVLICLLFGAGIGVVGGLFQGWAIRQTAGSVRSGIVKVLVILWGLIFAVLSLGSLPISWLDTGGGCRETFLVYSSFIYVCVAPFIVILLFGAWVNGRIWRGET